LEKLAQVEVTSEDRLHPIESALLPSASGGWRAAEPGEQLIRVIFDEPQKIDRILLVFEEHELERSQEFVLRWSSNAGQSYREIVRQQWNFSPPGTVVECEEYRVQLSNVAVLELHITPHKDRLSAVASLAQLRLA
jgi:hypothetical protein